MDLDEGSVEGGVDEDAAALAPSDAEVSRAHFFVVREGEIAFGSSDGDASVRGDASATADAAVEDFDESEVFAAQGSGTKFRAGFFAVSFKGDDFEEEEAVAGADDVVVMEQGFFVARAKENAVEGAHILNLSARFRRLNSGVYRRDRRVFRGDIGAVLSDCYRGECVVKLSGMFAREHAQRSSTDAEQRRVRDDVAR